MGWAGGHCLYSVSEVTFDSSYEVNRTFQLETEGVDTVELQVDEGDEVSVFLLEGRDKIYLVPSDDYYTQTFSSEQGQLTIPVRSSPLYLLVTSQEAASASVFFSPNHHSNSDSSALTYILVGVLVPLTVLFLILTSVVLFFKMRRRPQLNAASNPTAPLTQPHVHLLEQLNLSSPVKKFSVLSSHFSSECAVCLESFQLDSEVRMLDCGHVYHSACLENLVIRQQSCCVCKQSFENKLNTSYLTTMGDSTQARD